MSVGEGLVIVFGVIAATIAVTVAMMWLLSAARGAVEKAVEATSGVAGRAEALVPELAAALRAPSYEGPCRCRACRQRPQEPCSDFSGD